MLLDEKPDRLSLLGDTNSSMIAIIAKRMHVPVYHLEAGNRCHDNRVPEEVNRRIIDHSSDILLPYTEQSRQNLIAEGIPNRQIFVTGNPINEVIQHYSEQINQSTILNELGLTSKKYFLVTMHREENVDIEERLRQIINGIKKIQTHYGIPVIVSTHPTPVKESVNSA